MITLSLKYDQILCAREPCFLMPGHKCVVMYEDTGLSCDVFDVVETDEEVQEPAIQVWRRQ